MKTLPSIVSINFVRLTLATVVAIRLLQNTNLHWLCNLRWDPEGLKSLSVERIPRGTKGPQSCLPLIPWSAHSVDGTFKNKIDHSWLKIKTLKRKKMILLRPKIPKGLIVAKNLKNTKQRCEAEPSRTPVHGLVLTQGELHKLDLKYLKKNHSLLGVIRPHSQMTSEHLRFNKKITMILQCSDGTKKPSEPYAWKRL